ncbi:MAG: CBS domain-containing protein [Dehalococcoidia bacterium]
MDRATLDRFISQPLAEVPLVQPLFVLPGDSVRRAVSLMRDAGQSCVLTMEGEEVAGIFTERDVLTKCMEEGFDWERGLMDSGVLTLRPTTIEADRSVAEAIALMHQNRYRTVPVTRRGKVIGIIRASDIVADLVEAYPEDVMNLPPRPHQVMERREGG